LIVASTRKAAAAPDHHGRRGSGSVPWSAGLRDWHGRIRCALLILARPGWLRGLVYSAIGLALPVGTRSSAPVTTASRADAGAGQGGRHVGVGRGFGVSQRLHRSYLIWVPLLLILRRAHPAAQPDPDRPAHRRAAGRAGADRPAARVYVVKVGRRLHARQDVDPGRVRAVLPVLLLPGSAAATARNPLDAGCWPCGAGRRDRAAAAVPGRGIRPGRLVDERGYEATAYQDPNRPRRLSRTKDTNL